MAFVGIGIAAGLLTNAVAIWMLFHPHKPVRLRWIRLFPQGAIPKEIDRIARRIGQTVGTHLLRAEDIIDTLGQPEFRERFDSTLRKALENMLDKELGNLRSEIPEKRLGDVTGTVTEFGERLLEGLAEYLDGESFEKRVREFVDRLNREFGDEPLERVLTPAAREQAMMIFHDLGEGVVMGPGFRSAIGEFFQRNLRDFVTSDESLERFVPTGAINFGEAVVRNYLPLVLDRFGQVLESPAAQERVRRALRSFIDGYLSQQGMFQQIVGRLIITERTLSQTVQALE
jgi:plasmid stabilization system protein ParE